MGKSTSVQVSAKTFEMLNQIKKIYTDRKLGKPTNISLIELAISNLLADLGGSQNE